VSQEPGALDELIKRGFRAVPVIFVGEESILGFSEPKLRKLIGL